MQNAKCYTLTRNAKCKMQNAKLRDEVCRVRYATLCVAEMPSLTDDIICSGKYIINPIGIKYSIPSYNTNVAIPNVIVIRGALGRPFIFSCC